MTLEQLRTFKMVVESGSLVAAAEKLHKTQPAVTMALQKLESAVGFALFIRDKHRFQLTTEGRLFLQATEQVLLANDRLKSICHLISEGKEAVFRFTYEATTSFELFAEALSACQKQYPDTEMSIFASSRFAALDRLMKGEVDLAISPWFPVFHGLGQFETTLVSDFRVFIVISPKLGYSADKEYDLHELHAIPEVLMPDTNLPFDSGNFRINPGGRRCRVDDIATAKAIIRAGLGWGVLAEQQVADLLASGELHILKIRGFPSAISGEVCALRRRDTSHGPVANFLWQQLQLLASSNKPLVTNHWAKAPLIDSGEGGV